MEDGGPQDESQGQAPMPAGWYPDGSGNQRWWTGEQWTDKTAPMPAPVAAGGDPKMIAALMHGSAIFTGFIGPLVAYFVWPNDPFIHEHSRQALNFQLTVLIGYLIALVLTIVLIGFVVAVAIAIVSVVVSAIAAVAASKGENYKYPFTIPFVKS